MSKTVRVFNNGRCEIEGVSYPYELIVYTKDEADSIFLKGDTPSFTISGPVATSRIINFKTVDKLRFSFGLNGTPEAGSNAGSDFDLNTYNDAGGVIGRILRINRSSGVINFDVHPTIPTAIIGTNDTKAASTAFVKAAIDAKKATAVGDVSTPNATDLASAITLANANKLKINNLLAVLRSANIITT